MKGCSLWMLCHSKDGTETSQDHLFYTSTISALLVSSTPESDYCFHVSSQTQPKAKWSLVLKHLQSIQAEKNP